MSHVRRILSAVSRIHPPSTTRCIPTSPHLSSSTMSPVRRLLPFASPLTLATSPFTRHTVAASTSPLTLQEEEYSFQTDDHFVVSDGRAVALMWDYNNNELPADKVAEALAWVRKNLTMAGFKCHIPLAGFINKRNTKDGMINALAAAGVRVSVVDSADSSILAQVRNFQSKIGDREAEIILFSGDCKLACDVEALVGPTNLHVSGNILKLKHNYYNKVSPRYNRSFPEISTRICPSMTASEGAVLQSILRAENAAEKAKKAAHKAAQIGTPEAKMEAEQTAKTAEKLARKAARMKAEAEAAAKGKRNEGLPRHL